MYSQSARFYDALYGFKDYSAAASALHDTIQANRPAARTLLDVACGTGRHLELLQRWYEVEGLDVNPDLLAIAQARLPDVRLHQQDMTEMELDARYDVVTCLFSSIAYVRTEDRLQRAIIHFERHMGENGILILEPFLSPSRYWTDRVTMNVVDQADLKIAWMYNSPPPVDGIATTDIHYLVGTAERVESFVERHQMGLFSNEQYLAAFDGAGLTARFDPQGFFGRGSFVATRS